MKKLLVSMMAAFMVFAIAGSAAAFSDGSLTAVIYNKNDKEVALDLGNVLTLDFTAQNVTLAPVGSFSIGAGGDYNAIDSFAELSVGIFAADYDNYFNYFATTQTIDNGARSTAFDNFQSAVTSIHNYYGEADKAVKNANSTNSYTNKMTKDGSKFLPGSYGKFNNSTPISIGEAVLVENGYVDMYLYAYDSEATLIPGATTDYLASFRIFTDGSIVMNPGTSAVPVPGAFILLFSGLLGLVGIRRKA